MRVVLSCGVIVLSLAAATFGEEHFEWSPDVSTAVRSAAESDRAVLIHFSAKWCGPCAKLERQVFGNQSVTQMLDKSVVSVRIDIDEHRELAEKYGVSTVPADVVIDAEQRIILRKTDPKTVRDYLELVANVDSKLERLNRLRIASAPQPTAFKLPEIRQPDSARR